MDQVNTKPWYMRWYTWLAGAVALVLLVVLASQYSSLNQGFLSFGEGQTKVGYYPQAVVLDNSFTGTDSLTVAPFAYQYSATSPLERKPSALGSDDFTYRLDGVSECGGAVAPYASPLEKFVTIDKDSGRLVFKAEDETVNTSYRPIQTIANCYEVKVGAWENDKTDSFGDGPNNEADLVETEVSVVVLGHDAETFTYNDNRTLVYTSGESNSLNLAPQGIELMQEDYRECFETVGGTLPAGLSLDAKTGVITGSPLVKPVSGNYAVKYECFSKEVYGVLKLRTQGNDRPTVVQKSVTETEIAGRYVVEATAFASAGITDVKYALACVEGSERSLTLNSIQSARSIFLANKNTPSVKVGVNVSTSDVNCDADQGVGVQLTVTDVTGKTNDTANYQSSVVVLKAADATGTGSDVDNTTKIPVFNFDQILNDDSNETGFDYDVTVYDPDRFAISPEGQDRLDDLADLLNQDNGNGYGDDALSDSDADGLADTGDNCPTVANPSQADADNDGVGDACDDDNDADDTAQVAYDAVAAAYEAFNSYLQAGVPEVAVLANTEAAIVQAEAAIAEVTDAEAQTALAAQLDELKAAVDNIKAILAEIGSDVQIIDYITPAELEAILLRNAERITKVPNSPLKLALIDLLNAFAERAEDSFPPVTRYIDVTFGDDPTKPVVTTTVPSATVVVNVISEADGQAVNTLDHHSGTPLPPNSYVCTLAEGCPGMNGGTSHRNMAPGSYHYLGIITVEGEKYRVESESFELPNGLVYNVEPSAPKYVDVPANHPAAAAINYVYSLGVMRGTDLGDGTRAFKPEQRLIRSEVFAISNRLAGITQQCAPYSPVEGNLGFKDLNQYVNNPEANWFMTEIKCARQFGSTILRGYPDGTMRPLQQITWAESAKVVLESTKVGRVLAASLPLINQNLEPWWTSYYAFLERNGVVLPYGNTAITRAQFAKFLYDMGQQGLLDEPAIAANTGA